MKRTLSNGVVVPLLGLGTFKSDNDGDAYNSVKWALEAGYRHIDTAQGYGNEESVGRAIRESGIPREEIFVTTKLTVSLSGYNNALKGIEESLERLGLDYVDLFLIHWPSQNTDLNAQTWKAFEEIYEAGKARAIGVSNFNIHFLETLKKTAKIMPMMNQVELHPGLRQYSLQEYCEANNILITSYGPLMKGQAFDIVEVQEIAAKHNKSIPNVIVRWGLQRGIFMIPKSVTQSRILANADVFDFELDEEDMNKIKNIKMGQRVYIDPDNAYHCPLEEIL